MVESAAAERAVAPGTRAIQLATAVCFGVLAIALGMALIVAVALPYGDYDALSLGTWSRQIAGDWPTIHFPGVYFANYNRPLFYFLQGTVWHFLGFHVALGRLTSLFFSVLLVAGVGALGYRIAPAYKTLAAGIAVVLLLLTTPFDQHIASGLTDIPVAALVTAAAVIAFSEEWTKRRFQYVCLGFLAFLAMLAKPSALPALIGLAAAVAIGPMDTLRKRLPALAAGTVGVLGALVYDVVQANRLHLGIATFLTGYTGGEGSAYYRRLADHVRTGVLEDGSWLGGDLRVLMFFALGYAVLRIARLRHRPAVVAALVVAVAWSWFGPVLANGGTLRSGIFGIGRPLEQIAVLVLAGSLAVGYWAPEAAIPARSWLARMLVWAVLPFVLWAHSYVFEIRALSPVWAPLIVLMVLSLMPAISALVHQRPVWIAIPIGALVLLSAYATYEINGLGEAGWRQFRSGGLAGLSDERLMRNVGLGGDFGAELNAVAGQIKPGDRLVTMDSRLNFFYLDQIDARLPARCEELRGARLFLLLESDEVRNVYGRRADPRFWESCTSPALSKVDERLGAYTLFAVGQPRPSVGGCGVTPPDDGLSVEFGRERSEAAATSLQQRLAAVGFVQAKVEQMGCSLFRVVESGVPSVSVGKSILAEAKQAHFRAALVNH